MNPAVLVALNLINEIFVANGNQEITGTNSNPVLKAILNSLYGITGDTEYLTTFDKTNLVSAINEVNDLVGQINSIKLFSGDSNPNALPPNGGDFELRDFYAQTSGGGNIALWIYTGVGVNGWVNLNKEEVLFVNALPTIGTVNILYVRRTDDSIWGWHNGSGGGDPAEWRQLGGGASGTFVHRFTYDGSNAVQNLTNSITELIDFQIENGCNYDDNLEIITPNQISVANAVTNGILYAGNKVKLIYK